MPEQRIKTGTLHRSLTFDRAAGIDLEARTVELAFASEEPYQRWFGIEVLDCQPNSIRLGRLNNGGALLDNHDTDEQIGVVEKAWVDADKVCRALVRFSKSPEGEEMFQDVQDGIRRHVSVGYQIYKYVEETTVALDGAENTICRVTDWEPIEVSLVAVPADPTVGVNRSTAGADEHDTIVIRSATPESAPAPAIIPAAPPVKEIKIMPDTARNEGREAEAKRSADLLALADHYAQFGARELVGDFIRNGKSTEQFLNAVMDKVSEKHTDARTLEIGLSQKEIGQYSIMRAVQAVLSGDWSQAGLERAASLAVAKRTGYTPEGFFVPVEAYNRGFSAGTAGEAGNLIQTSVLGNEFIDVLRNSMVLSKLGVRVLGGLTSNIAIPRKSAASTIASYSEIAAITASNPTTTQITMAPKRVGGQVLYSKQALIQGNPDVDMMLRDDLATGVGVQIENLAINGLGSSNQPRGLFATSGIGSVVGGANGLALAWSHLVDLESACANANSEPDTKAGYLINTKTRGAAKKTQLAANLPMIWAPGDQPLNSYRAAITNNVVSNGTKGASAGICSSMAFSSDWSDLVLALFGGLDIVVDPYTQAGTGQVVITANQFIDIACRQPASFAAMTDLLA